MSYDDYEDYWDADDDGFDEVFEQDFESWLESMSDETYASYLKERV